MSGILTSRRRDCWQMLAQVVHRVAMSTVLVSAAVAANDRPNIVLVIADDLGKNDLHCEGNQHILTPNIDEFFANAVRFTDFHVSTTCSPTRGALLTGRHPNRLNVFHTIGGRSLLFEDEQILPTILSSAGYATGMFGKWHLGDNYPFRPQDRGFQEVVRHGGGGIGQAPDYWDNDYFDDVYLHNGQLQPYEGYCTDVFFSEAMSFIESHQDRPFFCYLATNAAHSPVNCPERYIDLYREDHAVSDYHKRFYGMITNIDDNFGRLLNHLNRLGVRKNTIVVFMSDNGTAGGHHVYDAGMSGQKGSIMEGGHRVPFYLQWPNGDLQGGTDVHHLTAHLDILPTLLELAAIEYSSAKPLDGVSLMPILRGDDADLENRVICVDTQRSTNLVKYKDYSVMSGKWRLVNGKQLFDVRNDLKQTQNVIDEHPAIAERLKECYSSWWDSLLAEGVDQRYPYVKVGTDAENPTRMTTHDMFTGNLGKAWHQDGARLATQTTGRWKVEVETDGNYRICLRRFPRESSLSINATFPQPEIPRRIFQKTAASEKADFVEARCYIGQQMLRGKIDRNQQEVCFPTGLTTGKYDLEAHLLDQHGRVFPAYFVYIERL